MTPSFIIDCSMTMSWFFPDEATATAQQIQNRLISEAAIVPSIWYLEVANVLSMAEKRKRTTQEDSAAFLRHLQTFEIHADDTWQHRAFDQVMTLCRVHQLTSYDAAYLELAIRSQLPLASLDNALCKAAKALGLRIL
jgi:predicted nucleic acid-binding protein